MMDSCKDYIIETLIGSIKVVQYNRPLKKNATNMNMYVRVTKILNDAAKDEDVTVIVLTGAGDYYSSGNDFAIGETMKSIDIAKLNTVLKDYIQAFITFPKSLIAICNGPAIGIAATTLALCDLVFASENAFFYTPFTKLGISAEGCSTFTFPRLIGQRKAAEMLLYNHKMTANEALHCGFINYIYKPEEIQNKVWDKIVQISRLPQSSILTTKNLMKSVFHDELIKTNQREIAELDNIWSSRKYNNLSKSAVINEKSKL